jgi:hypothetical protein
MKYWKQSLLGAVLSVVVVSANAHGDHDHNNDSPINKENALIISNNALGQLIDSKKLAKTWMFKKLKTVTTQETANGKVWVISYENSSEKSENRRVIYVLIDEVGNYLGSNYTGKL